MSIVCGALEFVERGELHDISVRPSAHVQRGRHLCPVLCMYSIQYIMVLQQALPCTCSDSYSDSIQHDVLCFWYPANHSCTERYLGAGVCCPLRTIIAMDLSDAPLGWSFGVCVSSVLFEGPLNTCLQSTMHLNCLFVPCKRTTVAHIGIWALKFVFRCVPLLQCTCVMRRLVEALEYV